MNFSKQTRPSKPEIGVGPLVDPERDLDWKPDYENDSWFFFGRFDADGEKISYLYHAMIIPIPEKGKAVQLIIAIANETTGWYRSDDCIVPLATDNVRPGLDIKMPNGWIKGTPDDIRFEAALGDGSGKIALHLTESGPVMFNGGAGEFTGAGMHVHQYSIPRIATTGTIVIEGKTYDVRGTSWFDRQWQQLANVPVDKLKWSWIGLTLDTGEAVGIWSCPVNADSEPRGWATILHNDGSQSVICVDPSLGASGEWVSSTTKSRYPTDWKVSVPLVDAVLDVKPVPLEQEVVSKDAPMLSKYEGASRISGTWAGKAVTGFGCVELVGNWK